MGVQRALVAERRLEVWEFLVWMAGQEAELPVAGREDQWMTAGRRLGLTVIVRRPQAEE